MNAQFLGYAAIRALSWTLSFLPLSILQTLGKWLGTLVYYAIPKFRKRALSNLALASSLDLSPQEIVKTAKGSLQNVMITCLEYGKLARTRDISEIVTCENPEEAAALLDQKKGLIFFCGHQANWELFFLEGTSRMPGVAIGRPTKNKRLYNWVVSIREKFGGKIIEPRNAAREGLKALKKGCFLGIVGDQGMPQGGFACDFLGRRAFTSPLPAILAYRTGAPLLVATMRRESNRYIIRYSDPLYADTTQPAETEIDRLMRRALSILESSIVEKPSEWLWQHNRWKQQAPGIVKRPFRFDSLTLLLPQEPHKLHALLPHLAILRAIYPTEHFTIAMPHGTKDLPSLPGVHFRYYNSPCELFIRDYAPKLILNFTGLPALSRHYHKLAAQQILTLDDLWKLASRLPLLTESLDLSTLFTKVLCHAR